MCDMCSNNVQRYREILCLSKAELARKAGLSTLTIDRIESGMPCRLSTKRKILSALELGIQDLNRVWKPMNAVPGTPRTMPNRVREIRESLMMTQTRLARRSGVSIRTIRSVERGMVCRQDTKRKILLALGLGFEHKDHVFPNG